MTLDQSFTRMTPLSSTDTKQYIMILTRGRWRSTQKPSFPKDFDTDYALLSLTCNWSPRLARSHYCQQLTLCLSVCLSVTLLQIASFLFLDGIEPVLHVALYKTMFLDFWFKPPNAQNLLPKICTKSPISRLVWQIDRRCLGLREGFRGWPIQWNHAKCCGVDPCCHGNEIWARHGYPVACRLVYVFSVKYRRPILCTCRSFGNTAKCSESTTSSRRPCQCAHPSAVYAL